MADEVAKRNIVLLELGLVPEGHFHQQTVAREDVDYILPMKESNAKAVRKIYLESGRCKRNPIIVPICEYAGVEGEISDPFGGPIEAYRETRDLIESVVGMVKGYGFEAVIKPDAYCACVVADKYT